MKNYQFSQNHQFSTTFHGIISKKLGEVYNAFTFLLNRYYKI